MGLEEDVIGLLTQESSPLDDDEIAQRLGANRHYINAVCRRLAEGGRLVRQKGPSGKLTNAVLGASRPRTTALESNPPRTRSRQRINPEERVTALIARFSECVDRFEVSNAFPGPSLYFHEKAIERRRLHTSGKSLLEDERFFEYVYAMLPAWGMHRMGKQAAKVGDFDDMVDSFRAKADALEPLYNLSITSIHPDDEASVGAAVWAILYSLKVSLSETHIVAGSKALHHVLPDLVPPIDRQYTFRFFTGQKYVSKGEAHAFEMWFPLFSRIARECSTDLERIRARGGFMATGDAKIIDNAIMGYMQGLDAVDQTPQNKLD